MAETVTDNAAASRYELAQDGATAVLEYQRRDGLLVLIHTQVPEALGGRGLGSVLARAALEDARRKGEKVAPRCEFVAAYIERHPAYRDLVVPA